VGEFLSLQFQHMFTYIYISLEFFTCLMDHNSCGRITVFRLVVLFDLVLTPGGSVGSEQPMCSNIYVKEAVLQLKPD
jgi:hypothetical protein